MSMYSSVLLAFFNHRQLFIQVFRFFVILSDVVKLFHRRQQVHRREGRQADHHHDEQEVEEGLDGEVWRINHDFGHYLELEVDGKKIMFKLKGIFFYVCSAFSFKGAKLNGFVKIMST
jgi:hypothetical protein